MVLVWARVIRMAVMEAGEPKVIPIPKVTVTLLSAFGKDGERLVGQSQKGKPSQIQPIPFFLQKTHRTQVFRNQR